MKMVIDAVNELKADLESSSYTSHTYHNSHPYLSYRACGWELNVHNHYAGTVKDFELLVFELSHAAWIKGASLAEYQAADKEVLKVENETDEFGGMVYEIGKVYEFSDNIDGGCWIAGVLESINHGDTFHFTVAGCEAYKHCRSLPSSCFGTITPAPVKLIDGEAYMFDCQGETRMGFKFGEYLRIDKYTKFTIELCANITHLTPSK